MSEMSDKILCLIKKSGISYGDLSTATKIPKSALQRYATGETEKIPLDRVAKIAAALNSTPAYLMGWVENEPVKNDELDLENEKLFKNLSSEKKQQALDFLRFLQGR